MRKIACLLLLATAGAVACRPVSRTDVPLRGAHTPVCGEAGVPEVLPAVNAILDSAKAVAILSTHASDSARRYTFVVDRGLAPQIWALGANGIVVRGDSTAQLLYEVLRPQPNQPMSWAVRLVAAPGAEGQLGVERARYCAPAFRGTVDVRATNTDWLDRWIEGTYRRQGTMRFEVIIDAEGAVYRAERITGIGPLGGREETNIIHALRGAVFEPGRFDGVAVVAVDTL